MGPTRQHNDVTWTDMELTSVRRGHERQEHGERFRPVLRRRTGRAPPYSSAAQALEAISTSMAGMPQLHGMLLSLTQLPVHSPIEYLNEQYCRFVQRSWCCLPG